MFKVIVAGSEDFEDMELMESVLEEFLPKNIEIEIVIQGNRGASQLAERYSYHNNLNLKIIRANWDAFGKEAGYRRNEEMTEYADALVAFWNGKSKGIKDLIYEARKQRKRVHVERYEPVST